MSKEYKCEYCEKKFETEQALNSHKGKLHKSYEIFKPTEKMVALLRAKLDPTVKPTITAECAEANIARKTYYEWFEREDFVTWFNREFERGMGKLIPYLDKVGIMKATKDFKYWEAMQMKFGGYAFKSEQNNIHELKEVTQETAELYKELLRDSNGNKANREDN